MARGTSPTSGLWRPVQFPSSAAGGESPVMLEGKLAGFADGPRPAVVLHHPNPAGGGSMDSKILRAVADALYPLGVGALRYNSRGVGRSGGEYRLVPESRGWVEGSRETADVGAALHFLSAQPWVDGGRLALVGFSFGARMVLSYLRQHPTDQRVRAAVLIGFPVAAWDLSHLGYWFGPKLFITASGDTYAPPEQLALFVDRLPPPVRLAVIAGSTHFLPGREDEAGALAAAFLAPLLGAG
ncbi:MAG TPA: alpha/beta fold hydrolase [Chloroflexia bacterium]|nr:alpha/beta fold hydrolase [Chloroflexia bacterium]